jgi:uncharacterized protein YqfA (UPF0365 family)
MSLAAYIEQHNVMARIFAGTVYNVKNLDRAAAQALADRINNDLSPENLTCDGELDRATVQRRRSLYTAALKELRSKFDITESAY